MTLDVLPDSRAKNAKGRVFTKTGAWIPIFCANCGKEGGKCPEENMTFMFWMCNQCFSTHGHITTTMVVPDKVFFDKIANEQKEAYGRQLTNLELQKVIVDDCTPLATLLKEAQ